MICICFMYIGFLSICNMLQSVLNIMFLYLDKFWTKRIFYSKIQVLENTVFDFWQNFYNTKMVHNVLNLC